ncbi:uncharacterized protein AMSG_05726 [Thecamonas trahens ATCC 50062]|uniref:Zn(2)-C6 fungal-type domain-containing protein n=1 Tax=Thecamonas trahens ATCC 50062 TaxID=461836 RepID=A0A0L0DF82_THETB|nr:hypothetical protein AMSG_05726 [Thecamonas trahens ATCC 50062]KNC49973.1 hypothetical protein AMSG_05726 [Thecamonas trahens ATCC 50062]|eukprot:XP_013757143.1 hypothetical protein AMSG_05726 [Thecamonas trahens ATCC 50062]
MDETWKTMLDESLDGVGVLGAGLGGGHELGVLSFDDLSRHHSLDLDHSARLDQAAPPAPHHSPHFDLAEAWLPMLANDDPSTLFSLPMLDTEPTSPSLSLAAGPLPLLSPTFSSSTPASSLSRSAESSVSPSYPSSGSSQASASGLDSSTTTTVSTSSSSSSSTSASSTSSSGASKGKVASSACDRCRLGKRKCSGKGERGVCERCIRLEVDCTWEYVPRRRGQKPKPLAAILDSKRKRKYDAGEDGDDSSRASRALVETGKRARSLGSALGSVVSVESSLPAWLAPLDYLKIFEVLPSRQPVVAALRPLLPDMCQMLADGPPGPGVSVVGAVLGRLALAHAALVLGDSNSVAVLTAQVLDRYGAMMSVSSAEAVLCHAMLAFLSLDGHSARARMHAILARTTAIQAGLLNADAADGPTADLTFVALLTAMAAVSRSGGAWDHPRAKAHSMLALAFSRVHAATDVAMVTLLARELARFKCPGAEGAIKVYASLIGLCSLDLSMCAEWNEASVSALAAMVSCAPFAAAVTNSGADSRALADRCLAAVDEAEGAAASVQVPAASCSSKPAAHPYLMGVRYVAQVGRDGDEAAATDAAGEAFAKSLGTTLRFLASRVDNFGCGSSNTELKLLALAAAFVMLGEARGTHWMPRSRRCRGRR